MSQTRIKRRMAEFDVVEFSEESFTDRGEKIWKNMRIEMPYSGIDRVLTCDKGLGITEEWIEDTIQGLIEAIKKDFPFESFNVVRVKPNHIRFEYAGARVLQ